MSKRYKCGSCGRQVTSKNDTCSRCDSSDIIDDLVDLGIGLAIGSLLNSDDNSSSGSSSSSSNNDFDGFGGGSFGGGGAGSDW